MGSGLRERPLIVLTGFNAFAGLPANPSELIVREIDRAGTEGEEYDLACEVLPTEFAEARARIGRLIADRGPAACLCLGVNTGASAVLLERFAVNCDDARVPDNAGDHPAGRMISEIGPAAYRSTLPLEAMERALKGCGVPAAYSNHAGAFVCNHVFYCAADAVVVAGLATRVEFVHVPWPADMATPAGVVAGGIALADMVRGVRACLRMVARFIPANTGGVRVG